MKPEEFKQNVKDRVRVFEDGGIRLLKKGKRGIIRAVELSIIIPVGCVGQVPLNERVRANGNAHRLQQHHRADALAAVHPAFRLVDIGSRYDFFHQNSFRGANGLCQKQPKCGIIATNR